MRQIELSVIAHIPIAFSDVSIFTQNRSAISLKFDARPRVQFVNPVRVSFKIYV